MRISVVMVVFVSVLVGTLLVHNVYAGINAVEASAEDYPYVFETLVPWDKKKNKQIDDPKMPYDVTLNATGFFVSPRNFMMAGHSFRRPRNFRNYQPIAGHKPISGFRFSGYVSKWGKEEIKSKPPEYWISFDLGLLVFRDVQLDRYLDIFDRPAEHIGSSHPVRYLGFGLTEVGKIVPRSPLQTGLNYVSKYVHGMPRVWGVATSYMSKNTSGVVANPTWKTGERVLPWYGDSGGPLIDEKSGKAFAIFSYILPIETEGDLQGYSVYFTPIHHRHSKFLAYYAVHCEQWIGLGKSSKAFCASPDGIETLLTNDLPLLDYGFQLVRNRRNGVTIKSPFARSCAGNFLREIGQKQITITHVEGKKIQSWQSFLRQINWGAPNNRTTLEFAWRKSSGRSSRALFIRKDCMPTLEFLGVPGSTLPKS